MMFDPKCKELAEYFLYDQQPKPGEIDEIAEDIQHTIELHFVGRKAGSNG